MTSIWFFLSTLKFTYVYWTVHHLTSWINLLFYLWIQYLLVQTFVYGFKYRVFPWNVFCGQVTPLLNLHLDLSNNILAFKRIAKIAKSYYWFYYVCLSVRMEQLCFHRTDFHEIWRLSIVRKICLENSSFIKYENIIGYFTWRPIYIFDHISRGST